jgi:DNA gyrase subunit A
VYDLRKARERAHILEGQAVALANIDEVIATIKASPTPAEAKVALMSRLWTSGAVPQMLERAGSVSTRVDGLPLDFGLVEGGYRLSDAQAQAILDMRLNRLTGLEQDKIVAEFQELLLQIQDLGDILARPERLLQVIRAELEDIKAKYADPRRTEISQNHSDLTLEDLIEQQDVVVTLSHGGYAKAQPVTEYRAQRRGGRGKAATAMKDEDFVDKLFVANTHDTLLCFSSAGKMYWLKVYQLPQASRGSRGKPIVNLLPLQEGERINAVLPIHEFEQDKFVFMVTAAGTVKKTSLEAFSRPRQAGIIAIELEQGIAWSVSTLPTAPNRSSCARAAARPFVSMKTMCARWAARPRVCEAFVCRNRQPLRKAPSRTRNSAEKKSFRSSSSTSRAWCSPRPKMATASGPRSRTSRFTAAVVRA